MKLQKVAVTGDLVLGSSLFKKEELYCEVCKNYTEHEKGEITKCSICGSVYRDVKRYIICGKPDHPDVIKAKEALLAKDADVIIIDEEVAFNHRVKGFKEDPFSTTPSYPIFPNHEFIREVEDMKYSHLSKRDREANIEPIRTEPKYQRNEPCPCGSGKKYKKCCGNGSI